MVELGALAGLQGVLDRQLVEAELLGEGRQGGLGGTAEVHPREGVGVGQAFGELGHREVLGHEDPLPVGAGQGHEDPAGPGAGVRMGPM